jgi:hypothetical protein
MPGRDRIRDCRAAVARAPTAGMPLARAFDLVTSSGAAGLRSVVHGWRRAAHAPGPKSRPPARSTSLRAARRVASRALSAALDAAQFLLRPPPPRPPADPRPRPRPPLFEGPPQPRRSTAAAARRKTGSRRSPAASWSTVAERAPAAPRMQLFLPFRCGDRARVPRRSDGG